MTTYTGGVTQNGLDNTGLQGGFDDGSGYVNGGIGVPDGYGGTIGGDLGYSSLNINLGQPAVAPPPYALNTSGNEPHTQVPIGSIPSPTAPAGGNPNYGAIASMLLQASPVNPVGPVAVPLAQFSGPAPVQALSPGPQNTGAGTQANFGPAPQLPQAVQNQQVALSNGGASGVPASQGFRGQAPQSPVMLRGGVAQAAPQGGPPPQVQGAAGGSVPLPHEIANAPSANPINRFGANNVIAQGMPQGAPNFGAPGQAVSAGADGEPVQPEPPSLQELMQQSTSKPNAPALPPPPFKGMYQGVPPANGALPLGQHSVQGMDPGKIVLATQGIINAQQAQAFQEKYQPLLNRIHAQQHNISNALQQSSERIDMLGSDDVLKNIAMQRAKEEQNASMGRMEPARQVGATVNGQAVPPPGRGFLSHLKDAAGMAVNAYNTVDRGGQLMLPSQDLGHRYNAILNHLRAGVPEAIAKEEKHQEALVRAKEKLSGDEADTLAKADSEMHNIAKANIDMVKAGIDSAHINDDIDKTQKTYAIESMKARTAASEAQAKIAKDYATAMKERRMPDVEIRKARIAAGAITGAAKIRAKEEISKARIAAGATTGAAKIRADEDMAKTKLGLPVKAMQAHAAQENADSIKAAGLMKQAEAVSEDNPAMAEKFRAQAAALLSGPKAEASTLPAGIPTTIHAATKEEAIAQLKKLMGGK